MSPAEYVEVLALPTLREFFAAAVDRRLAYLSAISTYHIADYIMRANLSVGADPKKRKAELAWVRSTVRAAGPDEFELVEGMCNGTKHCGRDNGTRFTPGDEQRTKPFGFGPGYAGFGEGSFGPPRLFVVIDSRRVIVDIAVRAFLLAAVDAFPQHLGTVDLNGIRN